MQLYNELIEFVNERISRQTAVMQKNDLRRVVAEQQELLVRVRPVAGVTEQMFGRKGSADARDAEGDDETVSSSLQGGGSSMTGDMTNAADMASVASVEMQLRDILSEQLISIEEDKERKRNERLMAAENASTKYYLTHDYLEDGHKIFEATEAVVPHADKYIPTAFVKKSGPDETIVYK